MSLHAGHRQRVYEKMQRDALADHEWLEALLYNAVPRRNTNELAHALLKRFGSVQGVLSATMDELQSVDGVGASVASYLHCIGHFYNQYKKNDESWFYDVFSVESFLPFVKKRYSAFPYEVLDIYLLDADGRLLAREGFSVESIRTVQVLPEEITAFLLTKGAHGVVMVHNHPRGGAKPSENDDGVTKNLQMLCSIHNRLLCDHIIYAVDGIYSYYLSGRLQEISEKFSIDRVLGE